MSSLVIAGEGSLTSVELSTGNLIKAYKTCENVSSGLAVALSRSHKLALLAIQKNKPLIHQYSVYKEAVAKRLVLGTRLSAISVSPNNQWLAGGSQDGTLYIWNLESGALRTHNSEAHFQAITSLTWSSDSAVLASGGADARILVWRLLDLVSSQQQLGKQEPKHVFTNHTLSISQLIIGAGSFRECRLYSVGHDSTCCVFDIFTGRLLYTLIADSKINSLAVDPAERQLYLGCDDGIHFVPLYVEKEGESKLSSIGSIEGGVVSTGTIERVCKSSDSTKCTALALSDDGSLLYAGMDNGSVVSWATGSGQLTHKYRSSKGQITQLIVISASLENASDSSQSQNSQDEFALLQRNMEGEDLIDYIPPIPQCSISDYNDDESAEEIEAEMRAIAEFRDVLVQRPPAEEEPMENSELEELKKRHAKLQQMYDALWSKRK